MSEEHAIPAITAQPKSARGSIIDVFDKIGTAVGTRREGGGSVYVGIGITLAVILVGVGFLLWRRK